MACPMFHSRKLPNPPKCPICGLRACREILNDNGKVIGKFCTRHANRKLRWLKMQHPAEVAP